MAVLESTLEDLERRLTDQGAPIAGLLRPGLSDALIDDLTQPLGLSLPEELRVWWRWHDGSAGHHARETIGGGYRFYSLNEAIAQTYFQRELAVDWAADDADPSDWFPPSVIAVSQNNGAVLACDCAGAGDAPVPTRVRPRDEPYSRSVAGPSFATLIAWWVEALATRAWLWDADGDRWSRDPGSLPAERVASGLV